jgi:hypothetical protein
VDWASILMSTCAQKDPVSRAAADWLMMHGGPPPTFRHEIRGDLGKEAGKGGMYILALSIIQATRLKCVCHMVADGRERCPVYSLRS